MQGNNIPHGITGEDIFQLFDATYLINSMIDNLLKKISLIKL